MKEIVVDNFAGGGGASTGIEMAIGRSVDVAINHDPAAIAMHRVNHPTTKHYCEDVWEVDPKEACQGSPVALAWFSPDCKHHSRAKGGKPVDKNIRGLAWVAVRWAYEVRPRCLMLENVEEFMDWGPLDAGNRPVKDRAGETFSAFVGALTTGVQKSHPAFAEMCEALGIAPDSAMAEQITHGLGYYVEHRLLRACDYGAPTSRLRFFMIARCDGLPIVWPEPTHAAPDSEEVMSGKKKPWEPISSVLDFDLPCPSIFASSEEIKEQYGIRAVRPLKENTLKRIAKGIMRFVINNPHPFLVTVNHSGEGFRGQETNMPLDTITSKNGVGIVTPVMIRNNENAVGSDPALPIGTITTGGHHMLIAPNLIQYHSEKDEEVRGQGVDRTIMTVDASNRYGLVSSFLKDRESDDVDDRREEVCAFLTKYYSGGETSASGCDMPAPTITTKDRLGLVTVHKKEYQIVDIGLRMLTPRELFNAQGFPEDYVIDVDADGNAYPRSAQVARCGNAVCPPIPAALVRANLPELCKKENAA